MVEMLCEVCYERPKAGRGFSMCDECMQNRSLVVENLEPAVKKVEQDPAKSAALASMLITSGFSFDGFTIAKYSGYISGDDAVSIDRGFSFAGSVGTTNVGDALMASLTQIRRRALAELKEAAYALGCNAVIGVDFDYLTLDPQTARLGGGTTYLPYVFGVTANGNAVVIERTKL
jgi:uncharacterized protein YbjQ (UPF0145 family)